MVVPVLPHEFAAPDALRWYPSGNFISGGQSVFGETQDRTTAGGGVWMAGLSSIPILSTRSARMWTAILLRQALGDTKVIVPMCAGRIRAGFASAGVLVPHSDDTTFSDDTEYLSGSGEASLNGAIALRATTAAIVLPAGGELLGAEPFTLNGATYGPRIHAVSEILSVSGSVTTVRFWPPAREAFAAGAVVDFSNPRCTMRPVRADGSEGWPEYDAAWQSSVAMTFRESFR